MIMFQIAPIETLPIPIVGSVSWTKAKQVQSRLLLLSLLRICLSSKQALSHLLDELSSKLAVRVNGSEHLIS